MRISILTLGCKVNQAESHTIEEALSSAGHSIVDISENPEVCIINTCTVTSKSDYQSRQLIRKAHRAGARTIVTGCYSELNHKYVRSMANVEEVVFNANKNNIISMLNENTSSVNLSHFKNSRSRLFVKIQDGCDNSCSYCIIPKARGRSKSIAKDTIIEQIQHAVSSGYNEIVLTGIHIGAYGNDLNNNKAKLSDLLASILNKTKIRQVRLSSLEITEIDDELLSLLNDDRVCNHLHIPLQSGDDLILRSMNRGYDSGYFTKKINMITNILEEIALGSDVIVGYPGEGNMEFENTYNILNDLPFTYLHIFPFSARPNTLAMEIPKKVPPAVIKERSEALRYLGQQKKLDHMNKQAGKVLRVLIEENTKEICHGTTENYLKITLSPNENPRGALIYARIEGVHQGRLSGTLIKEPN